MLKQINFQKKLLPDFFTNLKVVRFCVIILNAFWVSGLAEYVMLSKQELSILIFYYLGYSNIQNWILRIQREAVTTIVTFHDIPFEEVVRFEAKMTFLKRKTNVISLDDYMLGKVSYEKINVVITFDDGYKGWMSNAIPILMELGLPATFFISSGSIGLSRERQIEFIETNLRIDKSWDKMTGCLFR